MTVPRLAEVCMCIPIGTDVFPSRYSLNMLKFAYINSRYKHRVKICRSMPAWEPQRHTKVYSQDKITIGWSAGNSCYYSYQINTFLREPATQTGISVTCVCMYVLPDAYKTHSVTHKEKRVRERRAKEDIWPQQRRSNGHDEITYVVFSCRAAVLRCIYFRGSVNLDRKNSTILSALTADWNISFQSRMNAGNKVIYGF